MDDLIEALTIFKKHMPNVGWPTNCEHDVLLVVCKKDIPKKDAKRLEELGFLWMDEYDCWGSFRFGSC